MSRRTATRALGVALLVTATAGSLAAPALAAGGSSPSGAVLAAMQRDFGLSADQARQRVSQEAAAARVASNARTTADSAYAGSWLESGKPVVAVADAARADAVRATGAEARVVQSSRAQLDGAKAALDRRTDSSPAEVGSWYVDEPSNSVVVTVDKGKRTPATDAFVAEAAKSGSQVRVEETEGTAVAAGDLVGGNAIYMGGGTAGRCSAGFAAKTTSGEPRLVTAGHCSKPGPVVALGNLGIGQFVNTNWKDGNDFAAVAVDPLTWTLQPMVNQWNGSNVTVKGSEEAPLGGAICKSGSTTQWTCGTVRARNVTVKYGQADGSTVVVRGLTQYTACVEQGDSGGSNISGDQAQGLTSGARLKDVDGKLRCLSSGDSGMNSVSWFQPINEALKEYSLTLVTG
ncbi:S1 family peptidase [Allokutzneria sp. A3M-2-11 16]|uniref:S1 family peptidase n=1 Tax=Allokutzneria sp. A3M-2-11 16 TaxID=2962043 RepID=UPI0020B881F4|nr:S1 family peptidase [Allokutzneria sp. A3M-2-11 16]MCP3800040.1 S1 family peptidase [Allokutzneria sp. A3M-2-11 16]